MSKKKGLWDGMVSLSDFNGLCTIFVEKHFILLNDSYERSAMDLATVYTGIEWIDADGRTFKKVIRDYGNSAPENLFFIDQAIDKAEGKIDWQQISGSNTYRIVIATIVIVIVLVGLGIGVAIFYKRRKAAFRYMQVARQEEDEEMQNPFQLNYN